MNLMKNIKFALPGIFLAVVCSSFSVHAQNEEKVDSPDVFNLHMEGAQDAAIFAKQVFIPAKDRGFFGGEKNINLEVTLYKPKGPGPFPLAVLNHGACGSVTPCDRTLKEQWMGRFLLEYGFAVLVPMRRGRGESEGSSWNEPETCNFGDQHVGLKNAIEDLDAVITYAKTLAYVDISKIVLEGISRGGILSVIYASKRVNLSVKGTISFVGGWTSETCAPGFSLSQFREAGTGNKVPSLWIYGENDRLWSNEAIRSYARSFDKGDGNLIFKLYPVPGDGHAVSTHERLWIQELSQFLERIGFQKGN